MALLIFDLDGTLIDSKADLATAVNATRAELNLGPLSLDEISGYVGDGAPMLIRRALGSETPPETLDKALEFFLGYYRKHALDETTLYPGVDASLRRLRAAGHKLAVLTNKPVRISRAILEGLGVAPLFAQVYGGNSFEFKKPHPIGIETLLTELSATAASTWMIGDTQIDIETARNAGVRACGVKWGFRPETFEGTPPDVVVATMADLEAELEKAIQ